MILDYDAFSKSARMEALREHDLVRDESSLDVVVENSTLASYDRGTEIYREGQDTDGFFVLLDGTVELRRGGGLIATLDRPTHFGEYSLIRSQRRYTVTALAFTPGTRVFHIPRKCVEQLADSARVNLFRAFARILSERLDEANARDAKGEGRLKSATRAAWVALATGGLGLLTALAKLIAELGGGD